MKKINKRKSSKVSFKTHRKHRLAEEELKKELPAAENFTEEELYFRKK